MLRRGLLLEYTTLGWNVVGTTVVIAAAIRARSVALAGFGLDSLIEIFASVIVVWQLTGAADRHRSGGAAPHLYLRSSPLVAYVLAQSAYTLATGQHPAPSIGGLVWLAGNCARHVAACLGQVRYGAWAK